MKIIQKFALLGVLALPVAANAATITESAAAPTGAIISQPLFGGSIDGGKDYSDNNGTPGQTFTTGASAFSVTSITVKGAGSFGGFDIGRFFVLSISAVDTANGGTISSGTLNRVTQEVSQAFIPASGTTYLTITLATPIALAANKIYEYDIYTTDNSNPTVQSPNGGYYAFANSTGDQYAGGVAMQNGYQGSNKRFSVNPGSINTPQGDDRTFFISGSVTPVPEASSVAFSIAFGTISLFAIRRRLLAIA